MKKCSKCGIEKPLSEFHKDKARSDGARSSCKLCYSKFHEEYYAKNIDKVKSKNKKMWLQRKYGLSIKEYELLKNKQDNKCVICQEKLNEGYDVHVDHSHKTGKIRGILCRWCNTGLGNFKDKTQSLQRAIEYLSHHENEDSQISS
jgi:hypothetical protein